MDAAVRGGAEAGSAIHHITMASRKARIAKAQRRWIGGMAEASRVHPLAGWQAPPKEKGPVGRVRLRGIVKPGPLNDIVT